jgi:hypothetical protein
LVVAVRGKQVLGAVSREKLPIQVQLTFDVTAGGCQVEIQLTDRWKSPIGRVFGMQQQYREMFAAVLRVLDLTLTELDPQVQTPPARMVGLDSSGFADGVLGRANSSVTGTAETVIAKADTTLRGGSQDATPERWRSVETVQLLLGTNSVVLTTEEVEALLGVAALVGSQPGKMPLAMVSRLEAVAMSVEVGLMAGQRSTVVQLTPEDSAAVDFLRQQAALRQSLPVRRVLICRDCRFEKVVNDDYQKLAERNRKLTALVGGLGATIKPGSISPFVIVGQLFRYKNLNPEFVCTRCQGMTADTFVVTFCPRCGKRHQEAALRSCPCGMDFRVEGARLLRARAKPVPAPAPALPQGVMPSRAAPPPVAPAPPGAGPRPPAPLLVVPEPVVPEPVAASPALPPPRPISSTGTAAPIGGRSTPGWYPDPWRQTRWRWWDGSTWTGYVG